MNSTTMSNDLAVGFDLPFVHTCDLGATWRGLGGVSAGHRGGPFAGVPQSFRSTSARTGLVLQGRARVKGSSGLPMEAGQGARVPESGATARERGERSVELAEATPRYGAPGQCPRRNSGLT
ncbi:hypothetical protein [Nocardiopsis kunsanensis]|uniref:Uncharacterized protein n=1 Tax=Nocardiopsis kunsanensis TaxID=141693 RepID=A0A918X9Y9_9ACTN|nr:hypothetical protein [Nocardiopsis kunsanensis]GHD18498.1 hypothetical protein GCM10007147_08760 [Nocardiopsis kunsanensis]